jgi:hypothetical protein
MISSEWLRRACKHRRAASHLIAIGEAQIGVPGKARGGLARGLPTVNP